MSQNSQKYPRTRSLDLGRILGKGVGKVWFNPSTLITCLTCVNNVEIMYIFVMYFYYNIEGAALYLRMEENKFNLYKMYILNVLGSKNMYWVLVW